MTEDELIKSNSIRAFLIGHLVGILFTVKGAIRKDRPDLEEVITAQVSEIYPLIYPLIQKEFYPDEEK